jgi:hypothetical protein
LLVIADRGLGRFDYGEALAKPEWRAGVPPALFMPSAIRPPVVLNDFVHDRRELRRRVSAQGLRANIAELPDAHRQRGRRGVVINAVLAAAGFNFHLLLRWLAALLRAYFLAALTSAPRPKPT